MENTHKKERSAAYPAISLEQALVGLQKVRSAYSTGWFGREEAVKALGHSAMTGPATRKVAALAHFGLLERRGNTYHVSPLAERIIFPKSEDDKKDAIITAAKAPKIFSSIIHRYADQALPGMLENVLIRDFDVAPNAAPEVANIFKNSATFAGILSNGIISGNPSASASELAPENRDDQEKVEITEKKQSQAQGFAIHSIELPMDVIVELKIPRKLERYYARGRFSEVVDSLEEVIKKIQKEEEMQ